MNTFFDEDTPHEYLRTRLENSFILVDGVYTHVLEVRADRRLSVRSLGSGQVKHIPFTDDSINYSTLPLGFVNVKEEAFLLSRIPARRYKQGLDDRGVLIQDALSLVKNISKGDGPKRTNLAICLEQMQSKPYPTVAQALKLLDEGSKSVAISPKFCLIHDPELGIKYLNLRNRTVGTLAGNTVALGPKYTYLKDCLKREGLEVK